MRTPEIAEPRWIVTPRPQSGPRVRLLCFPYAGGGATVYRPWENHLPAGVELSIAQLPGRDRRITEEPVRDIRAMVTGLAPELGRFADAPLVLFGHSMGGLLAFETAHWLREHHRSAPALLAVSGCAAPSAAAGDTDRRAGPSQLLGDDEFVELVVRMGGTQREVLAEPELRELFLPVLRADFAAVETYRHRPRPALTCPIAAFGGTADPHVRDDELPDWAAHSAGGCRTEMFPGGHFFLREHRDALLGAVLRGV